MNKTKIIVSALTALSLFAALPVMADQENDSRANIKIDVKAELRTGSTSTSTKVKGVVETKQVEKIKDRANREITRRINGLTKTKTRIDAMRRVATSTKTQIKATVDLQISSLNALKAKIASTTDITVLRADVKSITQSYRIYALIMPQINILAAADRLLGTADAMTTLGGKLQIRINEAATSSNNVSELNTLLSNFNAKVADAKVQAQAAITLTASLTPDNGDEAKFQANKKALEDARAKLRVGEKDLKDARDNAKKIVKGLKDFGIKVNASSTLKVKDKED